MYGISAKSSPNFFNESQSSALQNNYHFLTQTIVHILAHKLLPFQVENEKMLHITCLIIFSQVI